MVATQRTIPSSPRRGFTLVEILLVVGLLALLATFTWPMLRTDSPHEKIERSAESLVSLLSMCRAEAMLRGHPFRLTWPEVPEETTATLQPIVLHEGDPLEKPGEYRELMASWAQQPVIDRGVRVQLVQLGELDIAGLEKTDGRFDLPETPSLETVQFLPDGTAQPAVFVLTTPSEVPDEGDLQYWVVLDGMSGLSKARRPPTPEQLEAMLTEQAELPDLRFEEKTFEVITEGEAQEEAAGGATLGDLLAGGGGSGATASDLQEIQSLLEQALRGRGGTGGGNNSGNTVNPGGRRSGGQNDGNTNVGEGGRGGRNAGGRNRGQDDNAAPNDGGNDDPTTRQPGRGQRSRGSRNR